MFETLSGHDNYVNSTCHLATHEFGRFPTSELVPFHPWHECKATTTYTSEYTPPRRLRFGLGAGFGEGSQAPSGGIVVRWVGKKKSKPG